MSSQPSPVRLDPSRMAAALDPYAGAAPPPRARAERLAKRAAQDRPLMLAVPELELEAKPAGATYRWQKALRGRLPRPALYPVALMLATYANADGTNARPSCATLARDLARSDRSWVQRELAELEAAGWLEATARPVGRPVVWALTIPVDTARDL